MRDEARILGRLSHRNIVTVLDLIKLGDRWAIIMDFVPGGDLEMVLDALEQAGEAFPVPAALEIGTAILNALDAVFTADDGHGNPMGVIHRDIKPSNVRLTVDGEVKVLDFGVARVNMDTREAQTRATGWIGTERYMSPERILCEGDGAPGDVYAAVASIVELLLGRPLGRTPVLTERHTPWVEATLEELSARLPPSPHNEEVLSWMRRGLACEPEDRPTARVLSDALGPLARALPGEGVEAFSRRFMPSLESVLGRERQPATGILSELSGTTVPGGTINGTGKASKPSPEKSGSTLDSGRHRTAIVGALGLAGLAFMGVVVVVGVLVVVVVQTQNRGDPTAATQAVTTTPSATAAPEAPGAEAAPLEAEEAPPDVEGSTDETPTPAEEPSDDVEPNAEEPAPRAAPSPTPSPSPTPVAAADAPLIRGALVLLPDASSLTVSCSGVERHGTASVRIGNFPSGPCQITAIYLGKEYKTVTKIQRVGEVRCAVSGDVFKCS